MKFDMAKLWLNGGKIVTNSSGQPILCDACPCATCDPQYVDDHHMLSHFGSTFPFWYLINGEPAAYTPHYNATPGSTRAGYWSTCYPEYGFTNAYFLANANWPGSFMISGDAAIFDINRNLLGTCAAFDPCGTNVFTNGMTVEPYSSCNNLDPQVDTSCLAVETISGVTTYKTMLFSSILHVYTGGILSNTTQTFFQIDHAYTGTGTGTGPDNVIASPFRWRQKLLYNGGSGFGQIFNNPSSPTYFVCELYGSTADGFSVYYHLLFDEDPITPGLQPNGGEEILATVFGCSYCAAQIVSDPTKTFTGPFVPFSYQFTFTSRRPEDQA